MTTPNPPRPITIRRGPYGSWTVLEPLRLGYWATREQRTFTGYGWTHETHWPTWEDAMEHADEAAHKLLEHHHE